MRRLTFVMLCVWMGAVSSGRCAEPTMIDQLCAGYRQIETVSCQVRKTSEFNGESGQMLSRVYYQKPDYLHVENFAPLKRRIIADGKDFYYHEGDAKRAYRKPIDKLEGEWRIMQKSVPATPMEHLQRLEGVPEHMMDGTAQYPTRRSYTKNSLFVVVSFDAEKRPVRIEFFKSPEMKEKTADVEYGHFLKVNDTCWLTCLQRGTMYSGTNVMHETRRFDSVVVNKPIAPSMFDASAFLKDVEFVDSFEQMYKGK